MESMEDVKQSWRELLANFAWVLNLTCTLILIVSIWPVFKDNSLPVLIPTWLASAYVYAKYRYPMSDAVPDN